MNYSSYMTMNCVWEPSSSINEDTMMREFGEQQNIKCFKYGKNILVIEGDRSTTVSAQAYIVDNNISVGDKLDGQVVKSVDNIPEFDGSVPLKECLTWNS